MPGVLKSLEYTQRVRGLSKISPELKVVSMDDEGSKKLRSDVYGNEKIPPDEEQRLKEGSYLSEKQNVNGHQANGTQPYLSGAPPDVAISSEEMVSQVPPEIGHVTFGFLSLSTLITRLVQETFNGLTDLINEMSDLQVLQPGGNPSFSQSDLQVNGNKAVNNSYVNNSKKMLMLTFAQERRAQFIKVLVLSKWSRQAEEISKVIDLNSWLEEQKQLYANATWWMGELKRILGPVKMPNPDLKTALEVLSLGKALRLPDLGYIPPKVLSPEQMLKALRNINTLLSVRLNLHEKIPSHLRNFSISSGRATFQFPDEFEVELSIADEDPSSQLYFIDFRFIFSPAPAEIPAGRLRDQIEGKTNDVLKRENLQGCFEFLHDLTLTHKISILRNQAFEMLRGLWSEDLKVEAVHRSLVIQYWLNRPGGKNWIEIGIKRRKEKTTVSSSETQNIPHVAIRWFRGGKEITNVSINLELGDVSLQRILNKVIAMHTNSIFNEVATRLKETRIYSERLLKLKGFLSPTEPLDAFLFVQLTTSKAVKIIQEPVTGRFALLPASPLFARAEREINSLLNPAVEIHIRVANLRSLVFQEEIEGFARVLGWQELKSVIPGQETIRRLFPRDIQRVGFFGRNKWGSSWLLAFTTSLMGDSWWTVKLEEERAGPDAGNFNGGSSLGVGSLFKAAYRLPMVGTKSLITEPSCLTLSQIESTAVGMISKYTDALYLKKQKLQHRFGSLSPNSLGAESAILYIRFDDDHGQGVSSPSSPESLSWASEIVSLAFNGLDLATYSVFHTALAQLKTPIKGIKKLTSTIGDSVVFHPTSGEFAFHIVTSVGESTIPPLLDRLSSIQRLIYFLSVIRYYKLPCDSVSLSHVEFVYPALSSTLKAILYFPPGDSMRLSFDQGNPHLRIQDYLTSLLRSGDGLKAVLKLLRITLPLLRAFSALEASHLSNRVRILPRSVGWYSMQYENPSGKFDIKLRQRRDELFWFMKDSHLREGGEMNQQVIGLKDLRKARGEGWRGMNGGMMASLTAVEDLMRKIDELYQPTSQNTGIPSASGPSGKKRKAEDDIVVLD